MQFGQENGQECTHCLRIANMRIRWVHHMFMCVCLFIQLLAVYLRAPWTARRSHQSILKEINPGYSLEGLMLKLKLQYFNHLKQRADSLKKTLMQGRLRAGGEGGDRRWGGWMASPTRWTWVWVKDRETWRAAAHGVTESDTTERRDNIYLSTYISICHLSICTHLKPYHSSSVLILGTVLRKNSHPVF